jgi:superfamily II DNA or RNA helicase
MYILYFATSDILYKRCVGKLGMTEFPHSRETNLQTATPPGLLPESHDNHMVAFWETTATSRDELFDYEEQLHNAFLRYRLMRAIPGDSEWFDWKGQEPLPIVRTFLSTQPWIRRELTRAEIVTAPVLSKYLRKQTKRNTDFVRSPDIRSQKLDALQQPVIETITMFLQDASQTAGHVIAPCGFGKTVITCKSVKGLRRVVICAPSQHIQHQWATTLRLYSGQDEILEIGSRGTTNPEVIRETLQKPAFCVITTYASSHLLVDLLSTRVDILILDEAHHLAGIVAKENEGEGKTRRLMLRASQLGVKRLSLTFTPRVMIVDPDLTIDYLSMENEAIFGTLLYEVKLRKLITEGILPDYRLWTLRDDTDVSQGLQAKASMILEAWNAKEVVRGEEVFLLHHLLVFAETLEAADEYTRYFTEKCQDTRVFCVKGGDSLTEPLREFEAAKRAILVNCKVCGEGVDIPCANAVAITYPKHVRGAITQTILRAGRWAPNKPMFHILLPLVNDEDHSGLEHVLSSLAACDEQIVDEILLKASVPVQEGEDKPSADMEIGRAAERILIEDYGSSLQEITNCFKNVRQRIFKAKSFREIQALCVKEGIRTSVEYAKDLRVRVPELPENPVPTQQTWFSFLNPEVTTKMTVQQFVAVCEQNALFLSYRYDEWRGVQPTDVRERIPSAQNISDGYFGTGLASFDEILRRYGAGGSSGRRR